MEEITKSALITDDPTSDEGGRHSDTDTLQQPGESNTVMCISGYWIGIGIIQSQIFGMIIIYDKFDQARDSEGISELSLIPLILPYKIFKTIVNRDVKLVNS